MTTIKQMRMERGLDTMINECLNTPERIARAKAKAERVKAAEQIAKANAEKKKQRAKSTKIALMAVSFVLGSMIGYIYHALMF